MKARPYLIKYLGRKSEFWDTFQSKFLSLSNEKNIEFESFDRLGKPIDSYGPYDVKELISFFNSTYDLILVEMSHATPDVFDLLKLFYYQNQDAKGHIVSLWDASLDRWKITKYIEVKFASNLFIDNKDSVEDAVRDCIRLLKFEQNFNDEPGFEINLETEIYSQCKVVEITPDEIIIESDVGFNKDNMLKLETNFFKNFPTEEFVVDKITSNDILLNFHYRITLNYLFHNAEGDLIQGKYDDTKILEYLERTLELRGLSETATNETVDEIMSEYQINKDLAQSKKYNVSKWITQNKSQSREDFPRILLVNHDFSLMQKTRKPLWEYPYNFFLYEKLTDKTSQLEKVWPDIIIYVLKKELTTEEKMKKLQSLIMIIDKFNKFRPFLYVMGLDLQEIENFLVLDYEHLTIHPPTEPEDKLFSYVRNFLDQHFVPRTDPRQNVGREVYFVKSHEKFSDAYLSIKAKILTLSTELIEFQTDAQIPVGTTLLIRIDQSTQFYVTYYESIRVNDEKVFKAYVHSISDIGKSSIRKYINLLRHEQKMKERKEDS